MVYSWLVLLSLKIFCSHLLDLKVDKRPVENVEYYEGTWEEEPRSPVGKWNFYKT